MYCTSICLLLRTRLRIFKLPHCALNIDSKVVHTSLFYTYDSRSCTKKPIVKACTDIIVRNYNVESIYFTNIRHCPLYYIHSVYPMFFSKGFSLRDYVDCHRLFASNGFRSSSACVLILLTFQPFTESRPNLSK